MMSTIDKPVRQAKKKTQTAIRLRPDVLQRLDTFCKSQRLQPTRNSVIELAIQEFLDSEEKAAPARRAS